MVKRESGCVQCGLPCLGTACPNHTVTYLICDRCGEYVDDLYEYEDEELCADCVLKSLTMVEVDDEY